MAGKPGRSGPPLNLNNSRYPWRSFWRRRALRREDKWVLPVLEGYAAGLARDKPNLTEAGMRVIELAQTARGAIVMILVETARSGFVVKENGSWNLAPGARELVRFLSIERACLQTLGLETRVKPANRQIDLSGLSTAELRSLRDLLHKAENASPGKCPESLPVPL